jgi:hypothetical protein
MSKINFNSVIYDIIKLSIVLLIFFMYNRKVDNLNIENRVLIQNNNALLDSLRVTYDNEGNSEFNKGVLIVNNLKELKENNKRLRNEISNLKGDIDQITEIMGSISIDTLDTEEDIITTKEDYHQIEWDLSKFYDSINRVTLKGVSKFKVNVYNDSIRVTSLGTTLLENITYFNIIQGLRLNKDGMYEVFVKSGHPNFNVSNLSTFIIDPKNSKVYKDFIKKRRVRFGVYAGIGLGTNNTGGLTFKPQIGLGAMYPIF